jgi:hypothetical protein
MQFGCRARAELYWWWRLNLSLVLAPRLSELAVGLLAALIMDGVGSRISWVHFAAGDLLVLSMVGVDGICAREVRVTRFAAGAGAGVSWFLLLHSVPFSQ